MNELERSGVICICSLIFLALPVRAPGDVEIGAPMKCSRCTGGSFTLDTSFEPDLLRPPENRLKSDGPLSKEHAHR